MAARTQVGIVGAGPAGLLLSHLLHLEGIESVVVEARSRDYVEHRVRAGVLEHGPVELLKRAGVGERACARRPPCTTASSCASAGAGTGSIFPSLTGGRSITVYGQQEVVKDLIRARLDAGGAIEFDVDRCRRARCRFGRAAHPLPQGRRRRSSSPATSSRAATASTASAGRRSPTSSADGLRAQLSVRLARHPRQGARRRTTS